ncbi:MAG: hypothetical protein OHK0044_07170 [Burkholderiaceae bacterium]
MRDHQRHAGPRTAAQGLGVAALRMGVSIVIGETTSHNAAVRRPASIIVILNLPGRMESPTR